MSETAAPERRTAERPGVKVIRLTIEDLEAGRCAHPPDLRALGNGVAAYCVIGGPDAAP